MKKIFTCLIAFALLAFGICIFAAPSKRDAAIFDKREVKTVKVLIIGSPGAGVSDIIANRLAGRGIEAVFVAENDYDGLTVSGAEVPVIAGIRGIIPMTTAARIEPYIQRKTETQCKSVSNFTKQIFYDVPPNDYGFSGESFANRIRASPRGI